MKILVACEESQTVCKAFRKLGLESYSCDLQQCSGGHPEWHIQGDAVEQAYSGKYDLMIAHPPCTYFSLAGSRWLFPNQKLNTARYEQLKASRELFMQFYEAPIEFVAIENPVPIKLAELPQFTQAIQPFQFGHPYSKKTLLWLKNLPLLKPTNVLRQYSPYIVTNAPRGAFNKGGNKILPTAKKGRERSKTFEGIAEAMADQWGKHIKQMELSQ